MDGANWGDCDFQERNGLGQDLVVGLVILWLGLQLGWRLGSQEKLRAIVIYGLGSSKQDDWAGLREGVVC